MMTKILLGSLILWNLVVFGLYAEDKRRAQRGLWRISEKTLLLLAFCFGGIGAIVSAHICHHKTRKWYFQIVWWLGLIVDVLVIIFRLKNK
ncbi:hypothetical protein RsY01_532 [Lactococcus reticulitermitis]|uniref:DUF1294 domain-containing protein n=2 Tax=Pseudolactococcus reticulitermitis TaxID=2025039 RepID=A0A224XAH9_9LACT|nr:hypothetical protein RsY01_532 [Lactococcus reticulitermitis]